MKKVKGKILGVIGVLAVFGIYYYAALPAFNIHSMEFWILLIVLLVLAAGIYGKIAKVKPDKIRKSKGMRIFLSLILIVIGIWAVGALLSSPIVNAGKYQKLMAVENGEFSKDIEELSFDQIPLLDKDSAEILGNRKMGSMVDMVSQFEVDELYSQINYQDRPVRVSPLKYADLIKWFTNRKEGIPAYIKIDMATQNTELVKLKEGMKYTTSDHFNRNIYRHLRFAYPTYIFNELSFEVDKEGVPYWICPVRKYNIGLFGGATVERVILCNAITGEMEDYKIEDVPQWIDRAYSADLLISLYDYYGTLRHGFLNSVLGQKDCLETTDGYNYLAVDDDVWVYTGVTSITGDTVSECEESYTNLMYKNGIKTEAKDTRTVESIKGKITKIAQGVVDGNSHYYLMLEGSNEIFDVSVVDFIDIIRYNVGDEVTVEYKEGEKANTVLSLTGDPK